MLRHAVSSAPDSVDPQAIMPCAELECATLAKSAKPWASKMPIKKTATKPKTSRMKADKKPATPKIPDTREDLIAKIGVLLDKIDALMAQPRNNYVEFSPWSSRIKEVHEVHELVKRLVVVLDSEEPQEKDGVYYKTDAQELIEATFGATPGTVPSWSRPGTFLVWINYIPCRCVWGGAAFPDATTFAADPKQPWMVPSGAVGIGTTIYHDQQTVEDLFRNYLLEMTKERKFKQSKTYRQGKDIGPKFELVPLDEETGRAAAEKVLAQPENAWLVEALERGEVNPIPLPPHLQAIQLAWFG